MAIAAPRILNEALGEKAADALADWIEQLVKERAVPRDEYRQVLSRLDILEHDVAGLKEDVRQVRHEIGKLRDEMNQRFDTLNARFDTLYERMLVQTRWTVGSIVLFGTIITVLLAVAQFRP